LEFVVDEVSDAVTVRGLKTIAADQAWLWSAHWQAKEAEAEADLVAGRTTPLDDGDAFLAFLR
jgi:antitoxin PrlF